MVGLETEYVRAGAVRVEWQLYELDTGELVHCPPKDDSYRTIDLPQWLSTLLADHLTRTSPQPCPCHGRRYVFTGRGISKPGATLADVARRAEVSTGTVSTVFHHPERVAEATQQRVQAAVRDLGFVRGGPKTTRRHHWRRNGFASWLFTPAASGWYPPKGQRYPTRPVPLLAEPWPGVPARGRDAADRAQACWLPIAPKLTPHGLRHTHRTLMEELRTERVLMDDRMGHTDSSISARYSHVTDVMRQRLLAGLDQLWSEALTVRRELSPRSPVATLDALLRDRQRKPTGEIFSQISPEQVLGEGKLPGEGVKNRR